MNDRAACALRAAEAGAAVAEASFRTELTVETKGEPPDVVTQIDRDAQARVIETIRSAYPNDPIVGEEGDGAKTVPTDGAAWIVDPIDGTNNFVRGLRVWATSVAAVVDGQPIAGVTVCPSLGDTYVVDERSARLNGDPITVSDRTDPDAFVAVPTFWWGLDRRAEYAAACRALVERFGDLRRFGSTQLALALCASGGVDAVVTNTHVHPWDAVAGSVLVERAGGTVTDVEGNPWRHDSRGLVASNGQAHERVLEAAQEIERTRAASTR